MTLRGFLACYLGAVVIVGGVGTSAYQELQRRHPAAPSTPVPVAEATQGQGATTDPTPPSAAMAAASVPAPVAAVAAPSVKPLPKLRPHVTTMAPVNAKPWPRVAVTHTPMRKPPRVAHNEAPVYQSQPYGQPPEMPYGYFASPAYYPYGGYYAGYGYYPPRYGYYRSY